MVEFINNLDPRWLILVWVVCAVIAGWLLVYVHIKCIPDDALERSGLQNAFSILSMISCVSVVAAMIVVPMYTQMQVLEILYWWGWLFGGLCLFLSLPFMPKWARLVRQTELYKWIVS